MGGVGVVDQEFTALRRAGGAEPLAEDAVAVAGAGGAPGDHEITFGIHGDRGHARDGGRDVDLDLAPQRFPEGVVAPDEDVFAGPALTGAGPRDDEVAVGVHGDRTGPLIASRTRVHAGFRSERGTRGAVALHEGVIEDCRVA